MGWSSIPGVERVVSRTQRGPPGTASFFVEGKQDTTVCLLLWEGYCGMPLTTGPLQTSLKG